MLDQTATGGQAGTPGLFRQWAAGSWEPGCADLWAAECSDVLALFEPEPESAPGLSTTAEVGRSITWRHYHRDSTSPVRTGTVWAEAPLQAGTDAAWWAVPDVAHPADLQPAVYVLRQRGVVHATDSGPDHTAARRPS